MSIIIVCFLPFLAMFLLLKKRDKIIIEEEEKVIIIKGFNIKEKIISRNYPYQIFPESHNLEPLIECINLEKGKA